MGASNAKLVVVKPEKRDGYVADKVITEIAKEARKREVPIEQIVVPARAGHARLP
jgi:transcriptional regulator NrdR family protein